MYAQDPAAAGRNPAVAEPGTTKGWPARLNLEYANVDGRSCLCRNEHTGPLAVQKALYPEGPAVCHTLVLHPPGGIVAGDSLDIQVRLQDAAHALITMPGASKWYRSSGATAVQSLRLDVGAGALLEWLPQETILFNGAMAGMSAEINLADGGSYVGWEVTCLGRTAAGETFEHGSLYQTTNISIAGKLAWTERCRLEGGSSLLSSPVALGGAPVCAVMVAAGKEVPVSILEKCRALRVDGRARIGVTVMPKILLARYIGHSGEQARHYFIELWRALRPFFCARRAEPPRIWST